MPGGTIGLKAVTCMRCELRFPSTMLLAQHTRFDHPVTEAERAEIIALWRNGENVSKISQEVMRAIGTVQSVLKRRPPTEYKPVSAVEPDEGMSDFERFVSAFEERVIWFEKTIAERDNSIARLERTIANLQTQLTNVSGELTSLRLAVRTRSNMVSQSPLLNQRE